MHSKFSTCIKVVGDNPKCPSCNGCSIKYGNFTIKRRPVRHVVSRRGLVAFLESLTQHFASSGDTISLAEHHLYGSSRLGVQRYDSTSLANILNLPEAEAANQRSTLRNRQPWYSYPFADLIDSTKRDPYAPGLTGNAYLAKWTTSRTLGRKYYEMTDHLGNVLATVLDRKTGAGSTSGGSLYDHWSADLASTADYYPGGFMMPNRNTEYSWSRMGYNGQAKDDEVYGKGNLNTALFWEMDTRLIRRWNVDPAFAKVPSVSPYSVFLGNPIIYNDKKGDVGHLVIVDNATGGGGTVFVVATYYVVKGDVSKNGFNETQMKEIHAIESNLNSQNYTVTEDIVFENKNLNGYKVQFVLNIKEVEKPVNVINAKTQEVTAEIPNANGVEAIAPNNSLTNYSPAAFRKLPGVKETAKAHGASISDMGAITTEDETTIAKQDGVVAYKANGATNQSNIQHEFFHTWGVDKDNAAVSEKSMGTANPTPNQDDINQTVKSLVNSGNVSIGSATPKKR